jgi:hypothetical protein
MAREPGILASALDPNPRRFAWAPGPGWQRPAWCALPDYYPGTPCGDVPGGGACSRCGWHALPDLGDLIWWLADFKGLAPHVIGGVELAGRVVRGSAGHPEIPDLRRAELVAVTGPLIVAPGLSTGGHVQALAGRYRADVRLSSATQITSRFAGVASDPRSWPRSAAADLATANTRDPPGDGETSGGGEQAWGPPGGRGLVRFAQ